MRLVRLALAIVVGATTLVVLVPAPTSAQVPDRDHPGRGGPFTHLVGFASKTGFRGVFAWQASRPVAGVVRFGTSPNALTSSVQVPGPPDTAQMAIADGLEHGKTYYWQAEDLLTGGKSGIGSFVARNAYSRWDGQRYTIDLLVQLDAQALPPEVPGDLALSQLAQGISVFAERVYDATDGYVVIGDVLVTDTTTDYATNAPFYPVPQCAERGGNLADVLVETSVPADSHTFFNYAIADPCTSFYVGRLGWLRLPSFPWRGDLDFAATAAHELSHYAFSAPDLYPGSPQGDATGANCRNVSWDGSLMHNTMGWDGGRWFMTELDRSQQLTPCGMGRSVFSWDKLRERYRQVPVATAPDHVVDVLPRGNPDGDRLRIHVLDREPGRSTLSGFSPNDVVTETLANPCGPDAPLGADSVGDAFLTVEPSDKNLDLTELAASWDHDARTLTVTGRVLDLRRDLDPPSPGTDGEVLDVSFRLGEKRLYTRAVRPFGGAPSYGLRQSGAGAAGSSDVTIAPGLSGAFDADRNEIRVVVPADKLAPDFGVGSELTNFTAVMWRREVSALLAQDVASAGCSFTVPARPAAAAATAEERGGSGGTLPATGGRAAASGIAGGLALLFGLAVSRRSRRAP